MSDASNWVSNASGGSLDTTDSVSDGSNWACDASGCLPHFELMAGRKSTFRSHGQHDGASGGDGLANFLLARVVLKVGQLV